MPDNPYKPHVTDRGKAKLAVALASGTTIQLTHIAVGDGGGVTPAPTAAITALRHEVWRGALNSVLPSAEDPHILLTDAIIPADVGGFFIREVGVLDQDGDLIGYAPAPESYNPAPGSSASVDFAIQMALVFADVEAAEITLDHGGVQATKRDVEEARAAAMLGLERHNAAEAAHPTLIAKDTELEARIERLELMLTNAVTGNPFVCTFDTLDAVDAQGVWNQPQARLEF